MRYSLSEWVHYVRHSELGLWHSYHIGNGPLWLVCWALAIPVSQPVSNSSCYSYNSIEFTLLGSWLKRKGGVQGLSKLSPAVLSTSEPRTLLSSMSSSESSLSSTLLLEESTVTEVKHDDGCALVFCVGETLVLNYRWAWYCLVNASDKKLTFIFWPNLSGVRHHISAILGYVSKSCFFIVFVCMWSIVSYSFH
jgi:hypothetical protein